MIQNKSPCLSPVTAFTKTFRSSKGYNFNSFFGHLHTCCILLVCEYMRYPPRNFTCNSNTSTRFFFRLFIVEWKQLFTVNCEIHWNKIFVSRAFDLIEGHWECEKHVDKHACFSKALLREEGATHLQNRET